MLTWLFTLASNACLFPCIVKQAWLKFFEYHACLLYVVYTVYQYCQLWFPLDMVYILVAVFYVSCRAAKCDSKRPLWRGLCGEGCAAIPEKRKFLFVLEAGPTFVFERENFVFVWESNLGVLGFWFCNSPLTLFCIL